MKSNGFIKGVKITVKAHPLVFKKPARTSRDTLTSKPTFILKISHQDGRTGIGECSLIPGLSLESESEAFVALQNLTMSSELKLDNIPFSLPAVRFAVETALIDFYDDSPTLPFSQGKKGIPINGLVWMGHVSDMLNQIDSLVSRGFTTIKLKVGTLPFEEEIEMLKEIRRRCPSDKFVIRIDANGAFTHNTISKLETLSKLNIHSIEQPIPAGRFEEMSALCASSPIPIALDEELIGIHNDDERRELLEKIKPQFIVLKPSLIGGLHASTKWVELAEELGIGWWATSALESNVGLSAIANWTAEMLDRDECNSTLPQGLGTGSLFTNNIDSNLVIEKGALMVKNIGVIEIDERSWELNSNGARNFYNDSNREKWTDDIADVLNKWFSEEDAPLTFKTSGTSGEASTIIHSRKAIIESANSTIKFFELKPKSRVVLALPVDFIAGRMMLIRAIVGGLVIEAMKPSSKPFWTEEAQFAALTPHQALSMLPSFPPVKTLLLGGAAIPPMISKLLPLNIDAWEGFGMTETITHIAVRKINYGYDLPFHAMPGVTFKRSSDGVLIINAPEREVHRLITDDLIELESDESFKWMGRKSDIINSGGIKVSPQVVERILHDTLQPLDCDYVVFGKHHHKLGEAVTLQLDCEALDVKSEQILLERVRLLANSSSLSVHHFPRTIQYGSIPKNSRGKTKRGDLATVNSTLPVLVFATANSHKVVEVSQLLSGLFEVKSLVDIGCTEDIPETATTLEGNAALKARYVKENYGHDCFADDTGLEVDDLEGAPGVITARYGGPEKDAQINMKHLLSELNKVPNSTRTAQFRTAIHLILGDEEIALEGICKGTIATSQSGSDGFGYDPIFIPKNETRTFSEMNSVEKNAISHRGRAITAMLIHLGALKV